jgi:phage gp45-like
MGAIADKIRNLSNKIQTIIQRVIVTKTRAAVVGEYPVVQVKGLGGKTTNMEVLSPYGLASVLPNGSLGVKFNIAGESSKQVGMAYDPVTVPSMSNDNEVVSGNFADGTYLKFTKGAIEVWVNNKMVIKDLVTHGHSGIEVGSGISEKPTWPATPSP